jgi:hypothetical protein
MPSATLAGIRELDARAWRAATWWAPVIFQVVFTVLSVTGWLLAKWPLGPHGAFVTVMPVAALITTVASLLIGARLVSAESPRCRALGPAIAGSAVAALAIILLFCLWILPWLEPTA